MSTKPSVKKDKYIVDVCYDGCFALFPDSSVRKFDTIGEAEAAIRFEARHKANKKTIHVAVIEWNARDKQVTESIEWRTKAAEGK